MNSLLLWEENSLWGWCLYHRKQ